MCLSVPGQIIKIENDNAIVNINGNIINCNIQLIDNPQPEEYVLVHAGFAIEKITEQEAKETLDLFEEFENFQNEN